MAIQFEMGFTTPYIPVHEVIVKRKEIRPTLSTKKV